MFHKIGIAVVMAAVLGACSLHRGPKYTWAYHVVAHGEVEHIGRDFIVVRFVRMTVEGTPDIHTKYRYLNVPSILKVFRAHWMHKDGPGSNYPKLYQAGDSVTLTFSGRRNTNPAWWASELTEFIRDAQQSGLPYLRKAEQR